MSRGSNIITHNNHQISALTRHRNTMSIATIALYYHLVHCPPIAHPRIFQLLPAGGTPGTSAPVAPYIIPLACMPYTSYPSYPNPLEKFLPAIRLPLYKCCWCRDISVHAKWAMLWKKAWIPSFMVCIFAGFVVFGDD